MNVKLTKKLKINPPSSLIQKRWGKEARKNRGSITEDLFLSKKKKDLRLGSKTFASQMEIT